MLIKFLILYFTINFARTEESSRNEDRCLALALKGGANRGAYEAGAIYALVKNLPPEEVQYDVLSGVSVGALNAVFISTFAKGQEQEMSLELLKLWRGMKQDNFYQNWWGGVIAGVLWQKGIYDNSPLVRYLAEVMKDRTVQRRLTFNAVDANDGSVVRFTESLKGDDLFKALIASTSMPFIFPPVEFDGRVLIDGGAAWNLDVISAIHRCRGLVKDDRKIIVDVIDVERNATAIPDWNETGRTLTNYLRRDQIKKYYTRTADVIEAMRAFPNVKFRYVISPEQSLNSGFQILSVDPTLIETMIQKGISDVERLLNNTNQ